MPDSVCSKDRKQEIGYGTPLNVDRMPKIMFAKVKVQKVNWFADLSAGAGAVSFILSLSLLLGRCRTRHVKSAWKCWRAKSIRKQISVKKKKKRSH